MRTKLFLGIVASIAILFASCEKDEEVLLSANDLPVLKGIEKPVNDPGDTGPCSKYWFDHENGNTEGVHYGCAQGNGWCLPEVDVLESAKQMIKSLFDEIDKGNQSAYQSIVGSNLNTLKEYVSPEYWLGVLDGTLILRSRGDASTKHRYLIFKNLKDDVVIVCPFLN